MYRHKPLPYAGKTQILPNMNHPFLEDQRSIPFRMSLCQPVKYSFFTEWFGLFEGRCGRNVPVGKLPNLGDRPGGLGLIMLMMLSGLDASWLRQDVDAGIANSPRCNVPR